MSAARHLLKIADDIYLGIRVVALRTPARLAAFAILALVATWPLLSTAASLNSFRDAHVLGHYESAAARSILSFHELPLWDPYYCGGMYLLGTPQARFVSPTFLLTLLFGEGRAESLTIFAMTIVGLEGTFRYARERGARSAGAFLSAPIFALSGIFALSPELGWINFFSFELLPWAAFGTRIALLGHRRGVVIAAAALGWCACFGGTYAAPMAALWCAVEVLDVLVDPATRRRAATASIYAALIAVLGVSLAAVRLWPIFDTLKGSPRIIGGTPGNSWAHLGAMAFGSIKEKSESGTFLIGAFAIPAMTVGLTRRRATRFVAIGLLWTTLAAGYAIKPSLFQALRTLPVYSTLRYPERFLILAALAASVLAAAGVAQVEGLPSRIASEGRGRIVGVLADLALPLVVLSQVLAIGSLVVRHWDQAPRRSLLARPADDDPRRPFHQARGNRWALAFYEPMDRGSLSCWEAYPVPESPLLRGDLPNEEQLVDDGAGTLVERYWSPNRIDLEVDLTRPATVRVNQNYHAGWRASDGMVRSDKGLMVVDLPEGHRTVSLRFEPPSAIGGAIVSAVAAVAIVAIGWSARRRRRQSGPADAFLLAAAASAPCLAFGICAACIRAPPAFPTVPVALDGEPVVADGLANGVVRVYAKLAEGLTFEGSSLSNSRPRPNDSITLELDWRRSAQPVPGLGFFLHIEPSKGDALNGDHVLLSSTLDLDDAPPDKTLRDVVPIAVPDDAAGKTFEIWVGVWHMRGDGTRVRVVDPRSTTVKNGAILVGTFVVDAGAE